MRKTLVAASAALLLALAGCAGAQTPPSDNTDAQAGDSTESAAVLMVASSDLGDIVTDADGLTVYMFDKDTQGTTESACVGECLTNWPPVITDATELTGDGVTGELATIDTADGKKQLTLDGWPLYYFAGDQAAGEVSGQGVGGIWWVLSPAGEPIGK